MTYSFRPQGVCSRGIQFEIDENGCVHDVRFDGGCHGNSQGVARLAEGLHADELIARLRGIRCGFKQTSCPDQLAIAVEQAVQHKKD